MLSDHSNPPGTTTAKSVRKSESTNSVRLALGWGGYSENTRPIITHFDHFKKLFSHFPPQFSSGRISVGPVGPSSLSIELGGSTDWVHFKGWMSNADRWIF